jgi:hypothetical protein
MSDLADQLGSAFASAETYDVADLSEPATFHVIGGPVVFHFPSEIDSVSFELEGPGKVVVPSKEREEIRSFTVQRSTEVDLGAGDSVVGLELPGPGIVKVKSVGPPQLAT